MAYFNFESRIANLQQAIERAYKEKQSVVMKRSKIMGLSGTAPNSHDGYVERLVWLGILELFDKRGGGMEIYTIHLDALRKYKPRGIAPPQGIS